VNFEKVGCDVDEEKQNVKYVLINVLINNILIKNNANIVIATVIECCLFKKRTTLNEFEYLD